MTESRIQLPHGPHAVETDLPRGAGVSKFGGDSINDGGTPSVVDDRCGWEYFWDESEGAYRYEDPTRGFVALWEFHADGTFRATYTYAPNPPMSPNEAVYVKTGRWS